MVTVIMKSLFCVNKEEADIFRQWPTEGTVLAVCIKTRTIEGRVRRDFRRQDLSDTHIDAEYLGWKKSGK